MSLNVAKHILEANKTVVKQHSFYLQRIPNSFTKIKHDIILPQEAESELYRKVPSFSQWEYGHAKPLLLSLERLRSYYGVSFSRSMFGFPDYGFKVMDFILSLGKKCYTGEVRVRYLRELYGLSRKELTQIFGWKPQRIERVENGYGLSVQSLYPYCLYFKVSPDWVLFGSTGFCNNHNFDNASKYLSLSLKRVLVKYYATEHNEDDIFKLIKSINKESLSPVFVADMARALYCPVQELIDMVHREFCCLIESKDGSNDPEIFDYLNDPRYLLSLDEVLMDMEGAGTIGAVGPVGRGAINSHDEFGH